MLAGFALLISTVSSQAQEWFQVNSGTNKKLNTIDFPSSTIGYIGGNDSLLLKTTDGGQNWSPVNYTGITFFPGGEHIINLQFITEDIGFLAVGPYSGSYKTIDGGLTWTPIIDLTTCFNQGLYFFDENNGFIGGSGCFQGEKMNKMTAGVWSEPTINTPTWTADNLIVDYDFSSSNFGLAASRSGYVLRTTDGGANWDTIPTPGAVMNPLTSILIVNNNLAYAGYVSLNIGFGLYVSIDNGLTWQEDINSATFLYPDFMCLHQSGDGKIFSGGYSPTTESGVIFQNPGQWSLWESFGLDQSINSIDSYYDSIVFAVGDSGYIIVNQDWAVAGIDENLNSSVQFDMYPNPTSSKVNFKIGTDFIIENAHINIFSLTGELVHAEEFQHEIQLNKLQTGIYLVTIETENGSFTRRLVKE